MAHTFIILCVWLFCLHVCVCLPRVGNVLRGQKRVLIPGLDLYRWLEVNMWVLSTEPRVLWKSSKLACLFWFLETGFLCVGLAVLELAL